MTPDPCLTFSSERKCNVCLGTVTCIAAGTDTCVFHTEECTKTVTCIGMDVSTVWDIGTRIDCTTVTSTVVIGTCSSETRIQKDG